MAGKCFRHAVLLCAVAGILPVFSGCTNNEIPLVEFPKGPPPPPPASKPSPNGPQGLNTSQGDPADISK